MAKFRVDLSTGVPPIGYVVVEATDQAAAECLVRGLIHDVELTSNDDRILFDEIEDPMVVGTRVATSEESEEESINEETRNHGDS